jgi:lysozyme
VADVKTPRKPFLIALAIAGALYLFSKTKTGAAVTEAVTVRLARLILAEEGRRLTVYQDTGGVWTIGDGHKVVPGDGIYPYGPKRSITASEADTLRNRDMGKALDTVTNFVRVPVATNMLLAMASLAYNIGSSAFGNSTLVKKLNAGTDPKIAAAAEFPRWVYDNGKVDAILVKRRTRELNLFNTPDNA